MKILNIVMLTSILLTSCTSRDPKAKPEPNLIAELEYRSDATLGEGALWNYKTKELYWIDIEKRTLHLYHPSTKQNRSIEMPSRIGTVVPLDSQYVLTALEDGVYRTNLKDGSSEIYVDMSTHLEGKRLNDGKCDPSGRFWVGSMHFDQKKGAAHLFAIDQKGQLDIKIDSVTISNGIVWTADKTIMYYIDTPTSEIRSFAYDNTTGHISNDKVVIKVSKELGFPDGMTIDSEGMLWVGMWNGNAVQRFDPHSGKVIQTIEVPAHNVTSCAFGGENLDELYITTAKVDMTEEELKQYPLSGSVFKVKTGVKGRPCSFCNVHL